jgi:hypothetical protein
MDIYILMCIASMDEWLKKIFYVYTMKQYSS